MNLSEIRSKGNRLSGKASELNQKLCFAGIAIVWLFTISSDEHGIGLPEKLLYGILAFSFSLLIELLYYSISAGIWDRRYHYHKENLSQEEKKLPDNEIDKAAPGGENIVWMVFFLKIAITALGYLFIIIYLLKKISII